MRHILAIVLIGVSIPTYGVTLIPSVEELKHATRDSRMDISIAGADFNDNGLRDDVEIAIRRLFPEREMQNLALTLAMAITGVMEADDRSQRIEAAGALFSGIRCARDAIEFDNARFLFRNLLISIVNSENRSGAYWGNIREISRMRFSSPPGRVCRAIPL